MLAFIGPRVIAAQVRAAAKKTWDGAPVAGMSGDL
jgi:hypothetical protein